MQKPGFLDISRQIARLRGRITMVQRPWLSLRMRVVEFTQRFVNRVVRQPITAVNYVLLVLVVMFLVLVLGGVISPAKHDTHFLEEAEKTWSPPAQPPPSRKSFEYYRQQLSKKNLFRSETPRKEVGLSLSGPLLAEDQSEVLSQFVLVGIVSGEDPVAIIRSAGSDSGIHYRVGDKIAGFIITEIKKSGVVLSREGKNYHLKL